MIQWFPGHMAKARNEIEKNLKLVDIVMELVDARAPMSSQNPMLQSLIKNKSKIILLMKNDLADPRKTKEWLTYFKEQGITALAINVNNRSDISKLVDVVTESGTAAKAKLAAKGVQNVTVRALISGIPNVGKSTLINRLANKNIARTGDRPAITKHQQWIKVRGKFELLDTPGILWPKFEEPEIGKRLAIIGTIKYELVPNQDIVAYLLQYLHTHYPKQLLERFGVDDTEDLWETFVKIGKRRGALESGGHVDFDKVAEIVLLDFRLGRVGQVTLEVPEE